MNCAGRNCLVSRTLGLGDTSEGPQRSGRGGGRGGVLRPAVPRGRCRFGARVSRPSPFPGRDLSAAPAPEACPGRKGPSEKQGAVPTAQRHHRHPPPRPLSAASPARQCSRVHNRKLTPPRIENRIQKNVFASSYQLPIIKQGGEEASEKNSFHRPARFCSLVPRPRWVHIPLFLLVSSFTKSVLARGAPS